MAMVAGYFRPSSLEEAVALLAEPNRVILAGGTVVNADAEPPAVEVVDLQAVGLSGIRTEADGRVRLGAMTTLDTVVDHPDIPSWLQVIARAEAPSTLRTLATVGGTVSSRWADSLLLAAMLACEGWVELAGTEDRSLVELVTDGLPAASVVTAVTLDVSGVAGEAVTARTPADVPIVGAVARSREGRTTLALTGVGSTPVVVDPAAPAAGLDPPDDFRGTSDYRRHLAEVLSSRAVAALDGAR